MKCGRCRRYMESNGGRGLCGACRSVVSRNGTLGEWPRVYRRAGEWVEDYEWLRPEYGDAFPAIAARLGVSPAALERALRRSGYVCKDKQTGLGTGGRKVMVPRGEAA